MKLAFYLAILVCSLTIRVIALQPRGIKGNMKCKLFCGSQTYHLSKAGDCICHEKSVRLMEDDDAATVCSAFCRPLNFHVDARNCHCNGKMKRKKNPSKDQPQKGSLKSDTPAPKEGPSSLWSKLKKN
ncbi:hypothetical protein BDB01DRAFT_519757 [Pilobolus umbonatus]|nr:hypothetical protein BDB01DRAFT_519757 [Pilobolus umbonatus]